MEVRIMNRTIALLIGTTLLGSVPAVVHGHEDHMDYSMSPTQMVDQRLDHLTKKLDLTADQRPRVRTVLQDEATQMEPLHQQMKTIHDSSDAKLNDILTPDQQKKFAQMKVRKMEKIEKKIMKEK
jgi:periplasmic protein CpxP/Spy